MQDRRKSADGGLELLYRGRPVGFRVNFLSDLLGRSGGQEVSLQALTGFPLGKVFLLAGAGPRWISADRSNYYYGVRPDEVRPGRPAYVSQANWNWDLTLGVRVQASPNWTFLALFNREGFGEGIRTSPLIEQGAGAALIASLTYSIR